MDRPFEEDIEHHEALVSIIHEEIKASPHCCVSFFRYMDLALYHPLKGYYMQSKKKLGKRGDFFTNAHVGPIFGQVISQYLIKMLPVPRKEWALIEMGPGDGRLTEQVLQGLLKDEANAVCCHVYLIERSPYHRKIQKHRLSSLPIKISWVSHIADVPPYPFGIVYSNELIDSFPVHRIVQTKKRAEEIYVGIDANTLNVKEVLRPISPQVSEYLAHFHSQLEVGQKLEVNVMARDWIKEVSSWMHEGYVITIDYGGSTDEILKSRDGTLRCFSNHQLIDTPYLRPGELDITSHVNFDALQAWGKEVGLKSISFSTQSHFLIQSGILNDIHGSYKDLFGEEARKRRAIMQLIHPDAMGESFKVLVQRK